MKLTKVSNMTVWSALFMPVAGIFSSLLALITRRRPSWFAFSFSLALAYSYFPILWDVRNNFFDLYFYNFNLNYYNRVSLFLAETLKIEYISVVFLLGLLSIFILSISIGDNILKSDKRGFKYFIVFLLFISTLDYRSHFDIQKTTLSLAFFIASLNFRKWYLSIFLTILSVLIHPLAGALVIASIGAPVFNKVNRFLLSVVIVCFAAVSFALTPDSLSQIISTISIIPNRVIYYLSLDFSRFSSPTTTALVKYLRLSAVITVVFVSFYQIKTSKDNFEARLWGTLIGISFLCFISSVNEVLLERYFLALLFVSAYTAAVADIGKIKLLIFSVPLILNFMLHASYTIMLVHSNSYTVISNASERTITSAKGLFYPTAFLINFGEFGYSNQVIMTNARKSSE